MVKELKLKFITYSINDYDFKFLLLPDGNIIIKDLKGFIDFDKKDCELILEAFQEVKKLFDKNDVKKTSIIKVGRHRYGPSKYSLEQIEFLKGCRDLPDKEVIKKFNEKFGTNIGLDSRNLYNLMIREGIKIPIKRDRSLKEISCPKCGSKNLIKKGAKDTEKRGKVQKYKCGDCEIQFIDKYVFQNREQTKEEDVQKKETKKEINYDKIEYPEEIVKFVKDNTNNLTPQQIIVQANKKFDCHLNVVRLARLKEKYEIKKSEKTSIVIPNKKRGVDVEKVRSLKKIQCPKCDSTNFVKRGFQHSQIKGRIQRYSCKDCGNKFIEGGSNYKMKNDKSKIEEARKLREQGLSLSEIATKISGVTRQTIHVWTKDIKQDEIEKSKKSVGKPLIYTSIVIDFIRQCASQGMNSIETQKKCELEFEHSFNLRSLRIKAHQEDITFDKHRGDSSLKDIDPEIEEFIKKKKNMDLYELRDEIIIEFEKYIPIQKLRLLIDKEKIKNSKEESVGAEVNRIKGLRENSQSFNEENDMDFTEDLD